jgi:hypothetical protein
MPNAGEPRVNPADLRENEAQMREAAAESVLPGRAAKFLAAAERWRQLAELAENPAAAWARRGAEGRDGG